MALAFLCIVSSLASLSEDGCQIWTSVDRKDFNKTFVDASDPRANIIRPYGYKALIYEKAQIRDFCVIVPLQSGKNREIELKLAIKNNDPVYIKSDGSDIYENLLDEKETHCIKVKDGEKNKKFTFHCPFRYCNDKQVELWYRFQAIYEDFGPKCNDNYDEFPLDYVRVMHLVFY